MIRFSAPLLAGIVLVVGGCASIMSPETAGEAARDSLPDAPTQWASAAERVGQVEAGWLAQLNDDVLTALVLEAQENNRDLRAAAANVEASWALAGQARSELSPDVNLQLDGSESDNLDGDRGATSYSASLQASWELDVWGRIRAGSQAAVLGAQSAEADYVFSQYSLAASVARAYFLAIEAGQQVDVAQKTFDALSETDRIVGVQLEFGTATAEDKALARSDLASARATLSEAKGSQRSALRALEVLLGRYPSADIDPGTALPSVPPLPPAGVPSQVLERRPDVVAAERSVAAAFNSLDEAKAARMPTVSLTGSLGGSSSDLSNLLNPTNVAWQAASSLVAPLIDGGLREAQVDQANAEQKQAIANYAQTVLDVFEEIETSLDQNVVLKDQAISLEESAIEANKAFKISSLRYEEGEIELLDVLNIQQRVFAADSDYVAVERARLDEWVNLNLSLGGDWQSDETAS